MSFRVKNALSSAVFFILSFVPSAVAFLLVYSCTDQFFRAKRFPYPFELFGIAAGFGAACWIYAFVKAFLKLFGKSKKSSSAYTIEEKIKADHAEVLK